MCRALSNFLDFTGRWDEWLSLSEQAEAKAVAADEYLSAGWRSYEQGMVHYIRGQADAVLACAERALAHWQVAHIGVREHAAAMSLRGMGHQLKADFPPAFAAYRAALEFDLTFSVESYDVAAALNDLADVEQAAGDLDAAERDYREALRVASGVGDTEGVAIVTGNLAALALELNDWPRAESLAREALTLAENLGRLELIASDYYRLAEALMRQGKSSEALPYARRGVEIYTRLGSPDLEAARATLKECEAAEGS